MIINLLELGIYASLFMIVYVTCVVFTKELLHAVLQLLNELNFKKLPLIIYDSILVFLCSNTLILLIIAILQTFKH